MEVREGEQGDSGAVTAKWRLEKASGETTVTEGRIGDGGATEVRFIFHKKRRDRR